ncbi:MAG TPA: hypothetical protein EYP04_04105 [Anaerolineae bacterium]|nr:hypothetical protein [Anaerolineae bacterium]
MRVLETQIADQEARVRRLDERLTQCNQQLERFQADVDRVKEKNDRMRARLAELEKALAAKTRELDKAHGELKTAQNDLEWDEFELTRLRHNLESVQRAFSLMDHDRLLLIELRKGMPETREEALQYWENVRQLATQSNPALATKVDQIVASVDTYFDWVEREHESSAEAFQDFFLSGANLLRERIQSFTEDVFLVIITRMDLVSHLVDWRAFEPPRPETFRQEQGNLGLQPSLVTSQEPTPATSPLENSYRGRPAHRAEGGW